MPDQERVGVRCNDSVWCLGSRSPSSVARHSDRHLTRSVVRWTIKSQRDFAMNSVRSFRGILFHRIPAAVSCIVVVAIIALAVAGCWSPATPSSVPANPGPPSTGKSKLPPEMLLNHKWWKKKPTTEELDRLLHLIADAPGDHTIFIDDQGNFGSVSSATESRPAKVGERFVTIMKVSSFEYDRGAAVAALLEELNFREFAESKRR
jgi:hypothetical protein